MRALVYDVDEVAGRSRVITTFISLLFTTDAFRDAATGYARYAARADYNVTGSSSMDDAPRSRIARPQRI